MDNKKWTEYIKRMPSEYNDRGPGGPTNFTADDIALPISPVNLQTFDKCKSVVDLGCGVGRALALLKEKGKMVRGITLNPEEVKDGIEKYGLTSEEIEVGDIHELPYADDTFEGAISWESLEHAICPMIVLWECERVLKVGGKFLLFLPNKVYDDVDVHIINLKVDQVRALLSKTHFKLDDIVDYTGDSARYIATKVSSDTNIEELRKHNNSIKLRCWTELKK